jgi:hypothetical protein
MLNKVNMKCLNLLFLLLISYSIFSCSGKEDVIKKTEPSASASEPLKGIAIVEEDTNTIASDANHDELIGYDELSNEGGRDVYCMSAYNMDVESIPNIERPVKSSVKKSKFSVDKLFGIWVNDPSVDVPHATFTLDKDYFFVVDYDGDGDMPYEIEKDSITVYYNDFIKKGCIVEANSTERLVIRWEETESPTIYYKWKN